MKMTFAVAFKQFSSCYRTIKLARRANFKTGNRKLENLKTQIVSV